MAMIFTPSPAGMATLFNSPSGPVQRHLAKMASAAASLARKKAPVKSGALRDSISVEKDATGFSVSVDVEYAMAVIKGSAPRQITASGQTLKFPSRSGGAMVFRRSVQHPGTRADNFLNEALVETVAALG